jgi:serine/threonine-protein kinase
MELSPGTVLSNRYEIETNIGKGGFSYTYRVKDRLSNQTVCIKELYTGGCGRMGKELTVTKSYESSFQKYKALFREEAQRLIKLKHSSIVRILDFFQENNTYYIVMDYIRGETLLNRIQTKGIKVKESFRIMDQMLDCVEYIHGMGIIHHDIKPANILITPENQIYLLDFGASRDLMYSQHQQYSDFLTESYAPPEQYEKHTARGPYTDIYALGATLYYILSGLKPVSAEERLRGAYLPQPADMNPKVSQQLSSAVMLALQLNPQDRFQTVHEFRSALNILQGIIKANLSFAQNIVLYKPVTTAENMPTREQSKSPAKEFKIQAIPKANLLLFPLIDAVAAIICFVCFYRIAYYFAGDTANIRPPVGQLTMDFNIINNQELYRHEYAFLMAFSILAFVNFLIEIISGKSVSMNFYRKEIVFNSKYIKSQFSFKFLRIVLKFLPLSFFIFMLFLKMNNIIETDIQLLSLGFISFATGTFLYTLFSGKYFFDAILGTEIKVFT